MSGNGMQKKLYCYKAFILLAVIFAAAETPLRDGKVPCTQILDQHLLLYHVLWLAAKCNRPQSHGVMASWKCVLFSASDPVLSGGGARNTKYKAPQVVAIFFMTSFNRDRGRGAWHPCPPPPGSAAGSRHWGGVWWHGEVRFEMRVFWEGCEMWCHRFSCFNPWSAW